MKIVFIGAGNVATHMATQLHRSESTIVQVYSKTVESAKRLASKVNASYTINIKQIVNDADYYIFSVKDSVLEDLIEQIPHRDGVWIHTAGSMPLDIFENKIEKYGVIYPLQTFSKNKEVNWVNIPLFIEHSKKEKQSLVEELAKKLSPKIYPLSTEKRKYVHASGVFACNFVNQMYELANQMIEKADLPFEVLLPLIDETCNKVHTLSPLEAQTGPAIRFDENVMDKHLNLLESEEQKAIYKIISQSIHNSHK